MTHVVTRKQFADLAGVTQASITKACAPGKALHPALSGKRIDAHHSAAVAYLESKGKKKPDGRANPTHVAGTAAAKEKKKRQPKQDQYGEVPEHIAAYADMTLREIIHKFGTENAFIDLLGALKKIEEIHEKRLKNAEKEGELVHRDLIVRGVFDPINKAHTLMLTDGAKNISRTLWDKVKAGRDLAECEAYVRDQIASFIRPVKAKVARCLRNQ